MVEKSATIGVGIPLVLPEKKRETAEETLVGWQKASLVFLIAGGAVGIWLEGMKYAIGLVGGVTVVYFLILLFKSVITAHSLAPSQITVTLEELTELDEELPVYSILVPLHREKEVVRGLFWSLLRLDYPWGKLQIILLLEEDDQETIEEVQSLPLPSHFEVVVVEEGYPKTKPRACNVGLAKVRGDYCVIYDAEDRPEEDQLKKAVVAFGKVGSEEVVCIQARLEFWNPTTNLLTRWFAAEYTTYYRLVLPGLGKLEMPVPLGGTSNHFRTEVLREIGGWDPYNVTEDIDLGMRLAKNGWLVKVLDSVTWEEANSQMGNWVRQRSRWVKGYIQTYLVHMRSPRHLLKDLGLMNFLAFQLIVGGTPLMMLFNPIFWVMTVIYALTGSTLIEQLYPAPIFYMGITSMIFGNFVFMYYMMTGCMLSGMWTEAKWALFSPIYWVLMSIGAWKALFQLIFRPHYWEKTRHGLVSRPETSTRVEPELLSIYAMGGGKK